MMRHSSKDRGDISVDEDVSSQVEQSKQGSRLPERQRRKKLEVSPLGKALLRFAGKAKDLPSDLAENHDHYLHTSQKKK